MPATTVLETLHFSFRLDGQEVRWTLVEAVLDEALHELPQWTFDLTSEDAFEPSILHKELVFEVKRGLESLDALKRVGVVVGIDAMFLVGVNQYRARLRVSSKAWRLGLNLCRRVFCEITATDALTAVFSGLTPTIASTRRGYEMLTQFDESDYDFARRVCEDEGLTLLFDPQDPAKLSVLNLELGTNQPSLGEVIFTIPDNLPNLATESIRSFVRELRACPTEVYGRAWNRTRVEYERAMGRPPTGLNRAKPSSPTKLNLRAAVGGMNAVGQVRTPTTAAGDALGNVYDLRRGQSNITRFTPGKVFGIVNPDDVSAAGEYLLTRVLHRFTMGDEASEGQVADFVYENEFECVDASIPHRPTRVTPRPSVIAPQLALVLEAPTREKGNGWCEVKLDFGWQDDLEATTAWVRVAQTLAGDGFGSQFIPRPGMEVVVHFIDGDPDRPVVIGVVYNGKASVPAELPGQHTRSVIRTRSYGSGTPDNELFFEDADGAEVLGLIATKDHTVTVTKDNTITVGQDRKTTIDRDETLTVTRHATENVDGNRTATIKGNDKSTTDGNLDTIVKGNLRTTVYNKVTISADTGIVLQCGDTKLELTPSAVTIKNSAGAQVELTPSAVTIKNSAGAKVELSGPMVNLN